MPIKIQELHLNHIREGLDYSRMHSNQLKQMMSPLPDFPGLGSRLLAQSMKLCS